MSENLIKQMNEKFDRNDENLRQIEDDNKLMNEKLEENNKRIKADLEKINEDNLIRIDERIEHSNKEIRENVDKQNEVLRQAINKKIEDASEAISQKVVKNDGERKQDIAETNRKLKATDEVITRNRAELEVKLGHIEEENRIQVESIRTDCGNQHRNLDTVMNEVQEQGQRNQDRIENLQRSVDNRSITVPYTQHIDDRETINFKAYRRNPMEFLERVGEQIMRTGENRWPIIRRYLDEHFKETYDNWWTATRHEIRSYEEFKIAFKARYWSDATQNLSLIHIFQT